MKTHTLGIFVLSYTLATLLLSGCTDRHRIEEGKSKTVTLKSLLGEMTERNSLTIFPEFRLKQVSSYDRTQTDPDDPSTWFNNKDYSHYIRLEENEGRTEYVIMEELKPGCIVRWWIPLEETYKNRIVRIYLDGNKIPVIEENYHDLISGKAFVKPPFAFVSSDEENSSYQLGLPVGHAKQMGANLYLPIPFAKSCKITLDDNPFYYEINYRVYDPETNIETFSMQRLKDAKNAIKRASDKLSFKATHILNETNQLIPPGKDLVFNLPDGQKAIKNIHLKLDPEISKDALRSIVLQADFDSKETIWCPVTEFFSGGVYVRPVENWNSSVTRDGLFKSNWLMPYKKSGNIKISNYGDTPISFDIHIETESYAWKPNSLYFHANWHEEAPIKIASPKDWNYIEIEGKGVYTGDVLTVHSFSKGWWGEGDEKIYVDDEREFPTMLGTGLEDYYGFAWGMPHHFNSPFISTTLRDAQGKGDWSGYTTVARMRLLDGIPFNEYLKVDVEAWLHDSSTSYTVATFWYGTPESKYNIKKDVNALKRNLPDFKKEDPVVWPGEKYSDPALDGLTKPLGNGFIKHIGNHIDLLDWWDQNTAKPMDADNDNIYGTAGYHFFAGKSFDRRNLRFSEESYLKLPAFIDFIEITGNEYYSIQDTWLTVPGHPDLLLITGGLKANHASYKANEVLRFKLINDVPEIFRLGVMTDNLDYFFSRGQQIMVTSSSSANSGSVHLAVSNRYPDWYFFDILNARQGDTISVKLIGNSEKIGDLSIGGICIDK